MSKEIHQCQCPLCQQEELHPDQLHHHQINLLISHLDEQQRRWYVALESFKIGRGGIELMTQIKKFYDPNMILNPGIGKGDIRTINTPSIKRSLKNQSDSILELKCMRCGFCITCPSRINYALETYSPRGRLCLLNGLVHGDLELNDLITEVFQTCTLCGLCQTKCPAGVNTIEIFEKTREIIHGN